MPTSTFDEMVLITDPKVINRLVNSLLHDKPRKIETQYFTPEYEEKVRKTKKLHLNSVTNYQKILRQNENNKNRGRGYASPSSSVSFIITAIISSLLTIKKTLTRTFNYFITRRPIGRLYLWLVLRVATLPHWHFVVIAGFMLFATLLFHFRQLNNIIA